MLLFVDLSVFIFSGFSRRICVSFLFFSLPFLYPFICRRAAAFASDMETRLRKGKKGTKDKKNRLLSFTRLFVDGEPRDDLFTLVLFPSLSLISFPLCWWLVLGSSPDGLLPELGNIVSHFWIPPCLLPFFGSHFTLFPPLCLSFFSFFSPSYRMDGSQRPDGPGIGSGSPQSGPQPRIPAPSPLFFGLQFHSSLCFLLLSLFGYPFTLSFTHALSIPALGWPPRSRLQRIRGDHRFVHSM